MLAWAITLAQLTSAAGGVTDPADLFSRPLGLPLLEARLQDVERLLGRANVRDEDAFVCYVAPTKDVLVRFVLDYLGTERRIGGFTMRELSGAVAAPCAVLAPGTEARASLNVGGLSLGMSHAEAIRILGPGPQSPDGRLFRQFTGAERDIVISARFHDDRLTELNVFAGWRRSTTMR
jgi:hypothetical protein